jgi:hypothetical protein
MNGITQRILKLIGTGKQEDLLKAKDILLSEVPDSPEYRYLRESVEWFLNHPEEASGYLMTALSSGLVSMENFCKNPFLHSQLNAGLSQLNSLWQQWVPQQPQAPVFRPWVPFMPQCPMSSNSGYQSSVPTFPHPPTFIPPFVPTWDPTSSGTNPTPFTPFPGMATPAPYWNPHIFTPTPATTGSFNFTPQGGQVPTATPFMPSFTPATPLSPAPPSPFIFNSPPATPTPTNLTNSVPDTPLPEVPKQPPQVQPTFPLPSVSQTFNFDDIVMPASTQQPQSSAQTSPQQSGTTTPGLFNPLNLGTWLNNVWTQTNLTVRSDRYKDQLKVLEEMGWYDKEECLRALDRCHGDVLKAVEILLAYQASNVSL